SSAVVYGNVESDQISDDSPPLSKHWMPYARAKATSEIWLREKLKAGLLETVVLRPGIVWGARSPHTINITQLLLQKNAFLVNQGNGVFNGIYIDNLLATIRTCCDHTSPVSGFFNVADAELVTWREFYAALGQWLDVDVAQLPNLPPDRFPWSKRA